MKQRSAGALRTTASGDGGRTSQIQKRVSKVELDLDKEIATAAVRLKANEEGVDGAAAAAASAAALFSTADASLQMKGLPSPPQTQTPPPSLPSLPDAAATDGDGTEVVATATANGESGGQTAHRLKLETPTHPHMQAMASKSLSDRCIAAVRDGSEASNRSLATGALSCGAGRSRGLELMGALSISPGGLEPTVEDGQLGEMEA